MDRIENSEPGKNKLTKEMPAHEPLHTQASGIHTLIQKLQYPAGFTLVDLMIVVAIIGILSAITYPSYQEALRKVRRAEARAALLQLMQDQERYYSQKGLYMPFVIDDENLEAKKFKAFSGTTAASSAYEISGAACKDESSRSCLLLKAVPGTSKVNDGYADPICGTLTLSTNGIKATIPVTPEGKCW